MDPQDPTSFRSKTQKLSTGLTYHYIDEKPANCSKGAIPPMVPVLESSAYSDILHLNKDTPVILALHGFPDRWFANESPPNV